MKSFRFLYMVLLAFGLAACYEVNEEIVINENGSGHFVSRMDMSSLIEMMQTFVGEEELAKEGLDRVIDTTIMMKSLIDSVKDITNDQRKIMENGKMHLVMNIREKIFKTEMDVSFTDYNGLQALLSSGGTVGLPQVLQTISGKNEKKQADSSAPKEPDLDALNEVYDITVKNGVISKKINPEKLQAIKDKPEMAQIAELANSGMEILYSTTIKLPRPVIRVNNELVKLSDDKKTVSIKYNLLDLFNTPDKFSYVIEW